LVDHRVAANAKDVSVPFPDQVLGDGDRFVGSYGLDRQTCGDVAQERQLDRAPAGSSGYHFDRTAPVPGALDEPLLLQVGQVLVNGGKRREAETPPDLFETRSIPVLTDEFVQIIKDLALALRKWEHCHLVLDCHYTQKEGEGQDYRRVARDVTSVGVFGLTV